MSFNPVAYGNGDFSGAVSSAPDAVAAPAPAPTDVTSPAGDSPSATNFDPVAYSHGNYAAAIGAPSNQSSAPQTNLLQRALVPFTQPIAALASAPSQLGSLANKIGGAIQDPFLSAVGGASQKYAPSPQDVATAFHDTGLAPAPNWQPSGTLERLFDNVGGAVIPVGAEAKASDLIAGGSAKIGQMLASRMPALAGAAASGVGQTAGEEIAPDSRVAPIAGALIGGLAGSPIAAGANLGVRALSSAMQTPTGEAAQAFVKNLPQGMGVARQAGTAAGASRIASNTLIPEVEGSGQAIDDVRSALADAPALTSGGFQPTAGTLSNNTALLTREAALAKSDPQVFARKRANDAALAQNLATNLQPLGASPEAASTWFSDLINGQNEAADAPVVTAKNAVDQFTATPNTDQESIAGKAGSSVAANAAEQTSNALQQQIAASKANYNNLYSQVPANLPVQYSNANSALNEALSGISDLEKSTGGINPTVAKFASIRAGVPGIPDNDFLQGIKNPTVIDQIKKQLQAQSTVKPVSFGDAQGDLRAINDATDAASAQGNQSHVRQLSILKRGLQADLEATGAAPGNEKLKAANSAYKQHQETFSDGPAGKALDRNSLPENTLKSYLDSRAGAQQLDRGLGSSLEANIGPIRDHFLNQLANSPHSTPADIENFLNKNGKQLESYPAIRQEIEGIHNRLSQRVAGQGILEGDLAKATEGATSQKKAIAATPAAQFAQAPTPIAAVAKVMGAPDADIQMKHLVANAARDKTGKAAQGLKNALKEHLNGSLRNSGAVVGTGNELMLDPEDLAGSLAKQNKILLSNTPQRRALEAVFSPQEMGSLDQGRKQLQVEIRRSAKATTGSDTAQGNNGLVQAAKIAFGWMHGHPKSTASLPALVAGHFFPHATLATGAALGAAKLGQHIVAPGMATSASALIRDAVLDPSLMSKLLLRPTPANLPTIGNGIKPYFRGVGIGAATASNPSQSQPQQPGLGRPPNAVQPAQTQTLRQQASGAPSNQGRSLAEQSIEQSEGTSGVQDGRREIYGFREGEGTGFDKLNALATQKGPSSPEVKQLASQLLEQRASRAGADQFQDPGVKAAIMSAAHMRGEGGARAMLNAVAGGPLEFSAASVRPEVTVAINSMDPDDFQQRMRTVRESYDRQFYGPRQTTVQTPHGVQTGNWWSTYGRGLQDRYNREQQQFGAMSHA